MASIEQYLQQGREALNRGDYAEALAQADAALAVDGGSFPALQLRSRALYLLGRDQEALQTLRKVHVVLHQPLPPAPLPMEDDLPLPPEEPELPPVDNLDALETLLALHTRYHLESDLLALLAELAEDAGRYDIAREAFETLLMDEPNRLDTWEGLVHVLCHTDLDAALDAVLRALDSFPTHSFFLEFLGYIRFRRRQYRPALQAYRQAVELGAVHPDNFEAMAECALALGDQALALDILGVLATKEPNDPETHRFGVELALDCGEPALALQHAHQLVRLQPSHTETYCYKAWVELAQGDWDAAARTLRLGFFKAVDGAYTLFDLVDLLLNDGAVHDAQAVAELAAELAPSHPETHAAYGKVLKERGALGEALDAFHQAATLAPHDDVYQTWIGIMLGEQGEYPAAIRQFNHVLARHPGDLWTLAHRGFTYLMMDVPERALADFSRGMELDPEEAHLYFWRACALVKLDDRDGAFQDLRRALDLGDEFYRDLAEEPLLDPLHDDPRFQQLLHPQDEE